MNCEIEFMPVGDASKAGDAIVIRYGTDDAYELMIVDGGNLDSGKLLVEHIRNQFGADAVISHVVLTHADADHACGLREVLSELTIKKLWLHAPWAVAVEAKSYFADKTVTVSDLEMALAKEYDLLVELVNIASKRNIPIEMPFSGATIGPFRVASPAKGLYALLLPQFDRTPAPDEEAIKRVGYWIGKPTAPALRALIEKVAAKVQKWVKETWDGERLKDGGITSASNESSVVLYADFGLVGRVLLTGDAGTLALTMAANYIEQNGTPLRAFTFVQIPHHGSRRNVGPTILNRILGPIQPQQNPRRFSAYVSAPKDDAMHPRKMVLNAFTRRGGKVVATQGIKIVYWGGFSPRQGYTTIDATPFMPDVEEYD